MNYSFKHIYGPVYSWRLGISLGIDPVSIKTKICNFDCVYCQLGRTARWEGERKIFVSAKEIMNEIAALPHLPIDYFTFSGRGEPTLAQNLGEMILALKKEQRAKIAVITNSSLMNREEVQRDLLGCDFVIAKLDAGSQETFNKIDKVMPGINFEQMVKGVKSFKNKFTGKLALQMMFMEQNKKYAPQMAQIAREIEPDQVEINTPLRACAVPALTQKELGEIKNYFQGLPVVSVYDVEKKEIEPLNKQETIRRHGRDRKKMSLRANEVSEAIAMTL